MERNEEERFRDIDYDFKGADENYQEQMAREWVTRQIIRRNEKRKNG
jgi:hypothetical protein